MRFNRPTNRPTIIYRNNNWFIFSHQPVIAVQGPNNLYKIMFNWVISYSNMENIQFIRICEAVGANKSVLIEHHFPQILIALINKIWSVLSIELRMSRTFFCQQKSNRTRFECNELFFQGFWEYYLSKRIDPVPVGHKMTRIGKRAQWAIV